MRYEDCIANEKTEQFENVSASLTLPRDLLAVETEQAESRHDDHRLDDDEEDGGH